MKDVAMNEKVFVKYEGEIRQAKVVGFETQKNSGLGDNWVVYSLYIGGGKTIRLDKENFGWNAKMYRTVDDVVNDNPIYDVSITGEQFTKAYMNGLPVYYNGNNCGGYKWKNNSIGRYSVGYGSGVKYLNGKATVINAESSLNGFFQTYEECRAHNAPKVVYLDD